MNTYTPQRIQFVGPQLEVFLGERERRSGSEPNIRPTSQELHHGLECVQRQAIVAVVRHVSHEHVDLTDKRNVTVRCERGSAVVNVKK